MEGDEISVVLSRVSELRSKITNSISDKTTTTTTTKSLTPAGDEEEDETSLFSIRDALESLQEVLSSLQALQQQQRYEREATLAEIDHSRKILLKKIKEYKGGDLEVIHEVSAFASETVEHDDDDLLLPPYPYPSHPHPLILDNGYSSSFPSKHNFSRNVVNGLLPINKEGKLEKEQAQTPARNAFAGFRFFLSVAAKTVVTLVGVVSILSLAGFEPRVRRTTGFKFKIPSSEEKVNTQCPPGKVLVMENDEPRCLVKERVEIPFEPLVATPDVSYGFG